LVLQYLTWLSLDNCDDINANGVTRHKTYLDIFYDRGARLLSIINEYITLYSIPD
jgi:hypothetical protein